MWCRVKWDNTSIWGFVLFCAVLGIECRGPLSYHTRQPVITVFNFSNNMILLSCKWNTIDELLVFCLQSLKTLKTDFHHVDQAHFRVKPVKETPKKKEGEGKKKYEFGWMLHAKQAEYLMLSLFCWQPGLQASHN